MPPLPIIFVHRGKCAYLPFTLGQAKLHNPASQIILLNDASGYVVPFARHVNMDGYSRRAREFAKVWQGSGIREAKHELPSLQRWLILNEFVQASGIERFVHIESDVLLYANISREAEEWSGFDLTFVRSMLCPGVMFVHDRRALAELAEIAWDTPLSAAAALGPRTRARDMAGIQRNGSCWDANINESEGFELRADGIKLARYEAGMPCCRQIATAREVRMNALHFRGGAKRHIEAHFRAGIHAAARRSAA